CLSEASLGAVPPRPRRTGDRCGEAAPAADGARGFGSFCQDKRDSHAQRAKAFDLALIPMPRVRFAYPAYAGVPPLHLPCDPTQHAEWIARSKTLSRRGREPWWVSPSARPTLRRRRRPRPATHHTVIPTNAGIQPLASLGGSPRPSAVRWGLGRTTRQCRERSASPQRTL
ncbi:hypothetical protein FKV25_15430, partial [Lysobacter aestuarii]